MIVIVYTYIKEEQVFKIKLLQNCIYFLNFEGHKEEIMESPQILNKHLACSKTWFLGWWWWWW
jgi:hypothetical protein